MMENDLKNGTLRFATFIKDWFDLYSTPCSISLLCCDVLCCVVLWCVISCFVAL
jgi:hypothetical protein